MFGYAETEAVGKSLYLIIPDDKRDVEADILRRLKMGEGIEPFQTTRCHRDGRKVPISITISPIKSRGGELVGASSTREGTQASVTVSGRARFSAAEGIRTAVAYGPRGRVRLDVCAGTGRRYGAARP
ncbi:PAS domain S-box-containing protein [Rhizobium sp. NFR07]|nr:PAS domain S-box-containing protein [Rhizobium sp. NFR07]